MALELSSASTAARGELPELAGSLPEGMGASAALLEPRSTRRGPKFIVRSWENCRAAPIAESDRRDRALTVLLTNSKRV